MTTSQHKCLEFYGKKLRNAYKGMQKDWNMKLVSCTGGGNSELGNEENSKTGKQDNEENEAPCASFVAHDRVPGLIRI